MFPHRVKYTESESDIQNSYLFYKKHQKCQNTFEFLENCRKSKNQKNEKVLCIMYKFHNSYFVNFVNFEKNVIFGFWDLYIYIYIYILHV